LRADLVGVSVVSRPRLAAAGSTIDPEAPSLSRFRSSVIASG
jgi:hypothetical protein